MMDARGALRGDVPQSVRRSARIHLNQAKEGLGERGPVCWTDGAPDYNRHLVKNTPYAQWVVQNEFN